MSEKPKDAAVAWDPYAHYEWKADPAHPAHGTLKDGQVAHPEDPKEYHGAGHMVYEHEPGSARPHSSHS